MNQVSCLCAGRRCCLCRALQISHLWGSIFSNDAAYVTARQLTRIGTEHICDVTSRSERVVSSWGKSGWRTPQECVLLKTSAHKLFICIHTSVSERVHDLHMFWAGGSQPSFHKRALHIHFPSFVGSANDKNIRMIMIMPCKGPSPYYTGYWIH